ncbi:hypothetical protein [Cyclobacterium lianum]|nr:hypothetical protein [Cyclobacterium lianum]
MTGFELHHLRNLPLLSCIPEEYEVSPKDEMRPGFEAVLHSAF